MFVLVEPLNITYLVERPDLGCATLVSAARAAGVQTALVRGQVDYLPEVFTTFSQEVADLLLALAPEDRRRLGFTEKVPTDAAALVASLRSLVERVRSRRTWRSHLDVRAVHELRSTFVAIMALYADAAERRPSSPLAFLDWYTSRVLATRPRCVGFSVNTSLDPLTTAVAARVKATGVPVVAGGAWTHGWDAAKGAATVLHTPFDAVVIGPGERALPRLLEALGAGSPPEGIPNVVARHGGEVVSNELCPLADLDDLPAPDFSDYRLDDYLPPERVLPVRTSTGCAWGRCAFCAYPVNSFRSCVVQAPEHAVEMIAGLAERHDCRHFLLHDDELSPRRARSLSEALLDRGLDVRVAAYARLERGFLDGGLLPLMHAAGFRTLHWGLESGSDRVLGLMRKGTTTKVSGRILEGAAAAGLSNHCFVMLGFPGETREEADETLAFLRAHAEAIDSIGLQAFVPSPDAAVGRDPERWGLRLGPDGVYEVANGLSQDEARRLVRLVEQRHALVDGALTSSRARLLQSASGCAVTRGIVLAHGVLTPRQAAAIARESPGSLFPVFGGDVDGLVWQPVDFTQSLTLARLKPPARRQLDSARGALVEAGDGTRPAEELLELAGGRAGQQGDRLLAFLSTCLGDGLALGLSEPAPAGHGPAG